MAAARRAREKNVAMENPPQLPIVGKAKKAPLVEKSVNASASSDIEDALASLTAKLQEVTLEKEKNEEKLKEKEAQLHQSEEDRQKLKKEVLKLKKEKAFEPQVDVDVLRAYVTKAPPADGTDSNPDAEGDEIKEAKEKRDPRKPKRPMSAYHLWNTENYQQVKAKHQEASMAEMSKIMSEMWKTVPEKTRKSFENKYIELMVVYKKEMAAYEQILAEEKIKEEALSKLHEKRRQEAAIKLLDQFVEHNKGMDGDKNAAANKKKQKDPEKPKQPLSAFLYFCSDRRKALPADDSKRNMAGETKQFSEEWKTLSDKAKLRFEKLAAADRERYAAEMEAYKAKKNQEEEEMKAELEKKQEQDLELAMSLMPAVQPVALFPAKTKLEAGKVKRGPSGYNLFCALMREKYAEPGLSFGDLSKRLGQAWKDLKEEEKSTWNTKAQKPTAPTEVAPSSSSDFGL